MPPDEGRRGWGLGLSAAIAAAVLVAVVFVASWNRDEKAPLPSDVPGPVRADPEPARVDDRRLARTDDEPAPTGGDAAGMLDREADGMDQDMIALRWSQVDLEALREEMPDNLYWELGAPTSDPAVEEARAERREMWNEAYGKVISGTATEEEIHAYFDERAQVSTDYLEFATRVLEQYGQVLPPRDVGLLELSADMHRARLQSMPRRVAEAIERKSRQDRLRAEWLADEAAFEQRQAEEVERAQR